MNFSKLLTRFAVCSIVILFWTVLICACITIINRGESNLNVFKTISSTQSCTQKPSCNC